MTNTLRMLRHMNVEVMSDQMYNTYQNALLFPAVDKVRNILKELHYSIFILPNQAHYQV